MSTVPPSPTPWREKLHEVIFEADTPAGKNFDIALLIAIGLSVAAVSMESVPHLRATYGPWLRGVEWAVTAGFTVEYVLRLLAVRKPMRYALSFFGLVDLLSLLPTYLSIFIAGSHTLTVIRALRLLRIFRILKLAHFVLEAQILSRAIRASGRKITIFIGVVLSVVLIVGSIMYMVEGAESGFTSIPQSIYWAIVTMTTVGYGDIAPQTTLGKFIASVVMLLGYGVLAVPTGIVSSEIVSATKRGINEICCKFCSLEGHDIDAAFCKRCGGRLD